MRLSELIKRPLYDAVEVKKEGDRWVLEGPKFVLELASEDSRIKEQLGDNVEFRPKSSEKEGQDILEKPLVRTGILYGEDLSFEMCPSNYLISRNNEKAYLKSMETLETKGSSLLIYGVPGVGKTHLLHALGWYALRNLIYKVAFFSASGLVDLVHSGFVKRSTDDVRETLSKVDVLLIDDFQSLDRKSLSNCVDFIFTVVDRLILSGKRVIVTSDVKSSLWKYIPERLRQRLTLMGSVAILPPDQEFAKLMLKMEAEKSGKEVSPEALDVMGKFDFKSVRKLKSVVLLLTARNKSRIEKDDVLYAVYEVIGDEAFVDELEGSVGWAWKKVVNGIFDPFEAEEILRGSKLKGDVGKKLQLVRVAFVALLKQRGIPPSEVARFFGVSKTTVYKWFAKDEELSDNLKYQAIRTKVREMMEMWDKR